MKMVDPEVEPRKPKMQWCLCPLNSDDLAGDIFLPDQGEVRIGRSILGMQDRRISRNHLGIRTQDNELSIKLLHKNPCHIKKQGQAMPVEMPTDRFMKLNVGDQISLMCAYAYAVDFKDVHSAQPPKFGIRDRTSSVMTTATEVDTQDRISVMRHPTMRQLNFKYEPVMRHIDRGIVPEEEEVLDEGLPQGDLASHMSWRDPDKEVPGPDRYHQDWLIITVTEDVKKVAPEPEPPAVPGDESSMFSNHSEEKCSYRVLYHQNEPPKSKWRSICGITPQKNE